MSSGNGLGEESEKTGSDRGGKGAARKTIRVVAAVIERDGHYLITRRRPQAVLPLLWEFPGGRVEEGEDDASALARELEERLGAKAKVDRLIDQQRQCYEHYDIDFYLYLCDLEHDDLRLLAVHEFRWVRSDDFDNYDFTPVDEASLSQLLGES